MQQLPQGWVLRRTNQGIEIETQINGVPVTVVARPIPEVRLHERLLYLLAEALIKQRSAG